ncbi:carboxypeptidase-like regulatory domain-containing protein [Hymenobacter norwichensis]|uniref:carboxypeptidase-like regulatory domain-containing protein n=1 Tax=Hymenobacter norwichensis TaxID=223903 RepID=UPI0003B4A817|nr:carboxypeptidase-like regulatory domain-containing protein [Hymenobacter norwichensis]
MYRFLTFLIGFGLMAIPGKLLAQQTTTTVPDSMEQSSQISSCESLTGLITDENYKPLTGATLQLQGINDAFSTNSEGRYIIMLNKRPIPFPTRLKVSAAGYETQEFALNTCKPTDVSLRLVPGTIFKRDGRIKKTTSTGKIKY